MSPRNLPGKPPMRGMLTGTVAVQKNAKTSYEKTLHEGQTHKVLPEEGGKAQVGVSMGLTIPGAPGSYMSARVDAWCSLPCDPDNVQAAYAKASEYVQEQLAVDAESVKAFFDSL